MIRTRQLVERVRFTRYLAGQQPEMVERLAEKVLAWQKTLPESPLDPTAGKNDYPWPEQAEAKIKK